MSNEEDYVEVGPYTIESPRASNIREEDEVQILKERLAEQKLALARKTGFVAATVMFASMVFFWASAAIYSDTLFSNHITREAQFRADREFAEASSANIRAIENAVEQAHSKFAPGPNGDQATIQSLQAIIDSIEKSNNDLKTSLSTWASELQRPTLPRNPFAMDFSLTNSAHADVYKGTRPAAPSVAQPAAGAPPQLPPAHGPDRGPLRAVLWVLLALPALAGVGGFVCVLKDNEELIGFGTNLITSVLGYYFGAGVSVLTVLLA